jgi:quinoprotein glucose dehydrogenase
VHHDLWEFDHAAPPVIGYINVDGKRTKAVMQTSKTGWVYTFDAASGKPVWPIEEKPVRQSTVPGEHTSPTQPFPTKPAPFDRHDLTRADLLDWPGFAEKAKAKADSFVMGPIFTPPVLIDSAKGIKGTLQIPGIWGVGSWNLGAFDPETGYYYAVSATLPIVMGLFKTADTAKIYDYTTMKPHKADTSELVPYWSPWGQASDVYVDSVPIFKPPWGRITAINMNTGDHVWQVPNGDIKWNHPAVKQFHPAPTGIPCRTVALVTKALLFAGDCGWPTGSTDGSMYGKWFRAYDKKSGKVIHEIELPAGLTGAPMTYVHRGRQYIVLPIGGPQTPPEWIALALPPAK